MSFAPGVGAVAPRSVRVCARIAPAKATRTLTASAIFVRLTFGRQNRKFEFENVIIRPLQAFNTRDEMHTYIIALVASKFKNLKHL
jgi:hypothetical protein